MNEFVKEYLEKELLEIDEKVKKENQRWNEVQTQLQQQFAAETGAHQATIRGFEDRKAEITKLLSGDDEEDGGEEE